MKYTKLLFMIIISLVILSVSAFALGEDVIVDMGPILGGEVEVTPGHINDDGVIDAKDVSLLAGILATGGESFTYEQLAAANIYTDDDNGSQAVINIKDLIALAQLVYKLENAPQDTRIISQSDVFKDEDDLYSNYYTAYNPYNGTREQIAGTLSGTDVDIADDALTAGMVAKVEDGKISEESDAEDIINPETDFVWITGYNEDTHTVTVLPEGSADENDEISYVYHKNSSISKLSYKNKNDIFKWGTINPVDTLDFFEDPDKTYYKCKNDKVQVGDTYKTRYAKYVKAYISPLEGTNIIDYAIIIVHDDEAMENLVL